MLFAGGSDGGASGGENACTVLKNTIIIISAGSQIELAAAAKRYQALRSQERRERESPCMSVLWQGRVMQKQYVLVSPCPPSASALQSLPILPACKALLNLQRKLPSGNGISFGSTMQAWKSD